MPLPKLAVGPVSEPSEPILIAAPPAPCEANSAHETVPAAAAPAGAAAAAVVGLGAAGAAVGGVVGADGVQATTVSASAISTFAWSQSNHDVFSYNVANIGGAIGFTVRF